MFESATVGVVGGNAGKAPAASDIICALRTELDGRTPEAITRILRSQFARARVEISEAELRRVADDIAHSPGVHRAPALR